MIKKSIFIIIAFFIFGWISGDAFSYYVDPNNSPPVIIGVENIALEAGTYIESLFGENTLDKPSPYDRIKESQIHVQKDKVVIDLEDAQWSTFTDTNSMDPILDKGVNAIQIVPETPDEIKVGDIISYESEFAEGIIIHRVIEIGTDENGWYCIAKGDNNQRKDPGRIIFSQIRRVVVAIIF